MSDTSEDAKHHLTLRGFTAEQAQELAQMQVQRVVVLTGNFLTTVITVITTALGLVTALAWNKYISDWLPTVKLLGIIKDPLDKELSYAVAVTLITVVSLGIVAIIKERRDKRAEAGGK